MTKITAPIFGFYGGNDNRIGATIPQATADMKAAGKVYEPVVYEGAGHGFMRAGQAPDAKPEDKKAYDEGFARLLRELKANMAGEGGKQTQADRPFTNIVVGAPVAAANEPDLGCCATMH